MTSLDHKKLVRKTPGGADLARDAAALKAKPAASWDEAAGFALNTYGLGGCA
jgi:hypothetical protein